MTNDGPSEKAKALIDENLRRTFHQIAEEPLPERFQLLLDQLRAKKPTPSGDGS